MICVMFSSLVPLYSRTVVPRNVVTISLKVRSHVPRRVLSTHRRISLHPLTLHVTHLYIHSAFFESPVFMAPTL